MKTQQKPVQQEIQFTKSETPMMKMRESVTHSSLKLKITSTLEAKIRYLCDKFPNTEWSGILFYKQTGGSFETNDMELSAEDFYLLDVGTACYTEYDPNPDVLKYQIDNDLLDCWWSLLHSHNQMQAYFSGTDVNTLNKIGSTMNHCLSLIVNNKGEYCARMTRIVDESLKVDVNAKYRSFNDEERNFSYDFKSGNKVLEWISADVEIEKPRKLKKDEKELIDSLISEIEEKKKLNTSLLFDEEDFDLFGHYGKRYICNDTVDETYFSTDKTETTQSFSDTIEKRFIYTLITGDMFPSRNAMKGSFDSIIRLALKTYSIKQMSIKTILDESYGVQGHIDNVVMIYEGLFMNDEEFHETIDDALFKLNEFSEKSNWIKEICETIPYYQWMN